MTGYLLSAAGGGLVGVAAVLGGAHMGLIVVGFALIVAGITHNIERKR